MNGGLIDRVESGAARGASALLAGAAGYAAYGFSAMSGAGAELALGAAGVGALFYLPCSHLLAMAGRHDPCFALPDFVLQDFEFSEPSDELLLTERVLPEEMLLTEQVLPGEMLLTDRLDPEELVLTAADRVDGGAAPHDQPLVLEDILPQVGPGARVIRLFDPAAMPAGAQSRYPIGDGAHQSAPSPASASGDASQALSAALAELRRSLR